MSQSPIDDFSAAATMRYRQGWKALDRLLHEDRSFSGHERNCAYLNLGGSTMGPRFADLSAASGLDFDDDARAIAVVDWDLDGDLDLWITNRTAPRIRLLRNDNVRGNHFVAIKLRGDGRRTNRDAVGARVEVVLADRSPRKLVKTLHAGDGFLSQSSYWLQFGLGSSSEIERIIVHWPGGEPRQYTGVVANQRYLIDQQTDEVAVWIAPQHRRPLVASQPQLPASTQQARIVLPAPLPLPTLPTGESAEALNPYLQGPTLINLWSITCHACLEELSDLTREADRLQSEGLDVVAVNLDNLDGKSKIAADVLQRMKFPFRDFAGNAQLIRRLDVFQRGLLDRWQTLPVPASFLVDSRGQVRVVYKGRVSVDRLIADTRSLPSTDTRVLRSLATPFAGRWIADPPEPDPLPIATQFIDHAMVREGVDYLNHYAQSAVASGSLTSRGLGDVFYVLAVLLRDQGESDAALTAYRKALEYIPNDFRAHNDLASLLAQRGQLSDAATELTEAIKIKPGDVTLLRKLAMVRMRQRQFHAAIELFSQVVNAHPKDVASRFNLANAYRSVGEYPKAVSCYQDTLDIEPRMSLAANNLAWILATHPDADMRNGSQAITLAKSICEQTEYRRPQFLDTLAAAYAEAGDFEQAIATAEHALTLLSVAGKTDQLRSIKQRLELFKSRQAFRDKPSSRLP